MAVVHPHIAKWGNTLVLRIPAEQARKIGIKEGNKLEARLTAHGGLSLRPAAWDRKAFAEELDAARRSMPIGDSVMEEVRRGGPY